MLPLPSFAYEAPDTRDDLLALAATPGARLLAGGTDLLPSLKHRLFSPSTLVSLRRAPGLRGVHLTDGELSIGAAQTLLAVRRHPLVGEHLPALADACAGVATRTIQAMGTLGGNLMLDTRCVYYNQPVGWRAAVNGCLKCEGDTCHVARTGDGCYAAHSADTVPVLWLMGARVRLESTSGVRELPVRELYDREDGRRWLRSNPGEVLTRIIVPLPRHPIIHRKVRLRASIDYAAVLVAVERSPEAARAVISAIGPAPIEVSSADPAELPKLAYKASVPLRTHVMATTWRRHMVRVSVRRALEQTAP